MEYLAAPWREAYVRKLAGQAPGCIFCRALKLGNDRQAYILWRGRHNFVMLNKFPYTPGHIMIAPLRHVALFDQAAKAASDELSDMLKVCLRVLGRHYRPQGFNTGMNLGQAAGAGVIDHYHLHVICRWAGDSNFMPLVAGAKVAIEDLATTYRRLRPLFQAGAGKVNHGL